MAKGSPNRNLYCVTITAEDDDGDEIKVAKKWFTEAGDAMSAQVNIEIGQTAKLTLHTVGTVSMEALAEAFNGIEDNVPVKGTIGVFTKEE